MIPIAARPISNTFYGNERPKIFRDIDPSEEPRNEATSLKSAEIKKTQSLERDAFSDPVRVCDGEKKQAVWQVAQQASGSPARQGNQIVDLVRRRNREEEQKEVADELLSLESSNEMQAAPRRSERRRQRAQVVKKSSAVFVQKIKRKNQKKCEIPVIDDRGSDLSASEEGLLSAECPASNTSVLSDRVNEETKRS